MSGRRRRQRTQLKGIDEINMTPLIDLTFLLLIVFMISMPMMEYSTDVAVPQMNSALPEDNAKFVTLKPGGLFKIDDMEFNLDQYRLMMEELFQQNPDYEILIRADGECTVEEFVEAAKIARNAGFAKAKMVTAAE